MTVFILPWKKYFRASKSTEITLNIYSKISIIFMTLILIVIAISGKLIPVLNEISGFGKNRDI